MRLFRRELLERIPRPLLVRILAPHDAFFAAAGISLSDLAATPQDDRSLVRRVDALLHNPAITPPPALIDGIVAIDSIATASGQATLFALCPELTAKRRGPEDAAATAFLDYPDAFARARRGGESPNALPFSEYNAVSHRAARDATEACKALEDGFRPWLVARGRTPRIVIHATERGDVLHVEIEHGRPPATDDVVDDALELTQVTLTRTERAHFILDRAKSHLGVHAAHPSIKDLLRRLVGEHFYGDPDHFRRAGIYTLAPLSRNLDEALSFADVPGIEGVELVGIIVLTPAERIARDAVGVPDLRLSPRIGELRSALAEGGTAEWCKLRMKLAVRKRVAVVEIEPSKKKVPGTGEIARIIDELLVARGFVVLEERRIVIESEAVEDVAAESKV
jgi:hypothetical protein